VKLWCKELGYQAEMFVWHFFHIMMIIEEYNITGNIFQQMNHRA
jgi:N-acetylglucosamine kinase-like BadF-type ATPase